MNTLNIVLGIILLIFAVFLVIAVLMQSGKSHNLSGTIAGGADSFFGKSKGKTVDRVLSKLTTVVAIIFALLVVVIYVIQKDTVVTKDNYIDDYLNNLASGTSEVTDANTSAVTEAATEAETIANETVASTAN